MNLQFEPIQIDKQHSYTKRLAQCTQVASDYSFLNLWAWAEDYGLRWAWDDHLIWIKQGQPQACQWAPIGAWEKVDWEKKIAESPPLPTVFSRIPEKLVEVWRKHLGDRIAVTEERGHWDYLYAVSDLAALSGNRFHKKKNLVNQFMNNYNFSYAPLGPELVEHAKGLQTDWCTWRDCESSDILSAENRAIYKILADWGRLEGTLGGALMVDQKMVAYTIAEALAEDTLLIHFEKADTEYKGAYQAINQMFLAHAAGHFKYVNREQDLDDEGLRKAKLSYQPIDFLRKCRVDLRSVLPR